MASAEYSWTGAVDTKWSEVQEDAQGLLRTDGGGGGAAARRRLQPAGAAEGGGGGGDIDGDEDDDEAARARARAAAGAAPSLQRGMMRNVFVVLDASRAMALGDLRPSRAAAVARVMADFVAEFFDQNPLSQLGVIVASDARAEKLTELSGNPRRHVAAIAEAMRRAAPGPGGGAGAAAARAGIPRVGAAPPPPPGGGGSGGGGGGGGGDFSLQNALLTACGTLALQPRYASREVLLVHGALASRDPGAPAETLAALRRERVRVSVISLPGEVFAAQRVALETGGSYGVPEGFDALHALAMAHCAPPPRRAEDRDAAGAERMVRVGFPELVEEKAGLCACHRALSPRAFVCPQCGTRTCEIPGACAVCGVQLVSAPALARSYHHLFPTPRFAAAPSAAAEAAAGAGAAAGAASGRGGGGGAMAVEDEEPAAPASTHCRACLEPLAPEEPRFVCPRCRLAVCAACDELIHETLHVCPGCAS